MALRSSFDYEPHQGVTHAVAKADGQTTYRSVSTNLAGARKLQLSPSAFAPERLGNTVRFFTTGDAYFADVCAALQGARKCIFIAGWQINWDVELTPGIRLLDALKSALDASPGLRIYVMPWMSPKVGVDTGDLGTMLAVFQLNAGRPGSPALCCPAGLQNDYAGVEETFFSHHQKLVVIDNAIAYVGGIDLAYGRRDDASFSLAHGGRTGCEVYNSGIPPQDLVRPQDAANYVHESSLLKVTLSAGLVNGAVQAQEQVGREVDRAVVGQKRGELAQWWYSSNFSDQLPEILRTRIDGLQAEIQTGISRSQDIAADKLIKKIDAGLLSDSDVAAAVSAIGEFMKATYLGLLGTNWLQKAPHAEIFKPTAKAPPAAGKLYRADQPRMPWHDVHSRIEGPSVYDLAMNFIRRWNSLQKAYLPPSLQRKASIAAPLVPQAPASGQRGGFSVRVLRSAAMTLQQQERTAMPHLPPVVARQHEIHDMMCEVIDKAERFLYIENQFFQSAFGTPSVAPDNEDAQSGPLRYLLANAGTRVKAAMTRLSAANTHTLPKNQIAERIAARIEHAIRWDQPFHVYMVLPVHPEGSLADIAIVGQIHWTMQSLVFASDSLINRIRLAMAARTICKQPRDKAQWEAAKRVMLEVVRGKKEGEENVTLMPRYQSVFRDPTQTRQYLTLLNLRTCEFLGGNARTEQIYVHSKLLIADDLVAIVGSANINDRSLGGGRDSELAVCVLDPTVTTAPIDGKHPIKVRRAAHELRVALWKKHFGEQSRGGVVQPASELMSLVDKPADPATWQTIQKVADANLDAYTKAFPFVPNDAQSIWPTWPIGETENDRDKLRAKGPAYTRQMPFSDAFWGNAKSPEPKGVKGFVCSLPLLWTEGENNHPHMNMALLTRLESRGVTTFSADAHTETPDGGHAG